MKGALFLSLLLCLCGATLAWGQVPQMISYQGRLTTSGGANVPDGSSSLTFKIYDVASGGTALWTETQTVAVAGGLFTANLGEVTALTLDFNTAYWLGVMVDGSTELTPRSRLTAAPYSLMARTVQVPLNLRDTTYLSTVTVSNDDPAGYGIFAQAWSYALYGIAKSPAYAAVLAENGGNSNNAQLAGKYGGVYGFSPDSSGAECASMRGNGVTGTSVDGTGIYAKSTNGDGLRCEASADLKSGIFAMNSNPSGYAGFFTGRVHVNGTLSKVAGSFRIDHPLDPANKYLQHSFVESPDMMNIYNGSVTLDDNGEAMIVLPDYFEALNQDFRYQLTAIGAPGPNLHIAQKIIGNQFRIAGGSPGMEVSWQVTGIRHDAYANAHRIQVEVDKKQGEKGKYLTPVEYGQPETMGIDYERVNPQR